MPVMKADVVDVVSTRTDAQILNVSGAVDM